MKTVTKAKETIEKAEKKTVVRQAEEDGRATYYYPASLFIDAIPGTGGIIASIAQKTGVTWITAKRYCTTMPTVMRAYQDECETVIDMAESVLMASIRSGDVTSAKWYLERKRADTFAPRPNAKENEKAKKAMKDMSDAELLAIAEG